MILLPLLQCPLLWIRLSRYRLRIFRILLLDFFPNIRNICWIFIWIRCRLLRFRRDLHWFGLGITWTQSKLWFLRYNLPVKWYRVFRMYRRWKINHWSNLLWRFWLWLIYFHFLQRVVRIRFHSCLIPIWYRIRARYFHFFLNMLVLFSHSNALKQFRWPLRLRR